MIVGFMGGLLRRAFPVYVMASSNVRELKRLRRMTALQSSISLTNKELEDIQKQSSSDDQVSAHMISDELTQWKGYLKGPVSQIQKKTKLQSGTPYEGGNFTLNIKIPNDYPYTAPKISFETRIWHPNVSSQTGAICLDVLKNEWSPALTIRTALLSIQALLSSPEPDDPQDAEVASMYKRDKAMFDQTAKMWTEMFAKNQGESRESKVMKIAEMGFTWDTAVEALENHNWNETMALNALLGG